MRTIGLLGGMSSESSIEYERVIHGEVRRRLGANHSGDLLLRSYDFAVIEGLQEADDWEGAGRLLAADASRLESAGADCIVLCSNTMHRVADAITARLGIPLLHIADATAAAIEAAEIRTVALLGTRYTMEGDFYRNRLKQRGLDVIIPEEPQRSRIHDIIFDELVQGIVSDRSREEYLEVIAGLMLKGAAGVVAGCTEIELLVDPTDVAAPYFPSARLHALAAVDFALR